jgi:hypothetical protein
LSAWTEGVKRRSREVPITAGTTIWANNTEQERVQVGTGDQSCGRGPGEHFVALFMPGQVWNGLYSGKERLCFLIF